MFKAEVSGDRKGRVGIAYLRVREGKVAQTREIVDGSLNADYDQDGLLLGVELYGRCDLAALEGVAAGEPEEVRRFLTGAAPLDLIKAAPLADGPEKAANEIASPPH